MEELTGRFYAMKAQRDKLLERMTVIAEMAEDELRRFGPQPNSNMLQIEANARVTLKEVCDKPKVSGNDSESERAIMQHEPIIGVNPERKPETLSEAEWFHQGVISGLTIYARESGASTLKSDNPLLARLMDEEGWRAHESFEAAKKS